MQIIFTAHAEWRLKKRKLTKEEILEAMKFPDKTLKKHGKYYVQKKLQRGTIEIVFEREETFIRVVTVYWL